jgi:hypothetical protein
MALDPLAAILDAINGPDCEDTDEYKQRKIDEELWAHKKWEKQILKLVDPTKPDFPESYWQAYSNTPLPPTTTFRPWNKSSGENFKRYTQTKSLSLLKYREQLKQKVKMANLQSTTPLPKFYHTTHEPTTTTFRPWDEKSRETLRQYRLEKVVEFGRIWRLMKKEQKMAEESNFDTSADFYVHNRKNVLFSW